MFVKRRARNGEYDRVGHDADVADDVVNRILLELTTSSLNDKSSRDGKTVGSFRAFKNRKWRLFHSIKRRRWMDHLRKMIGKASHESPSDPIRDSDGDPDRVGNEIPDPGIGVLSGLIRREEAEIVKKALDELTEDDRAFVLKLYADKCAQKDLVPEFGATVDAIRSRKEKVFKTLKAILIRKGVDE